MKTTIKQMSQVTGFSSSTISNALNRKKGVNKKTSEKILKAAMNMGYIAQRRITFVMYKTNGSITDDTPFFPMIMDGFQNECKNHGYEMVIVYVCRNDEDYLQQIKEITRDTSALVVLLGTEMMDDDFILFADAKCKMLVLDYFNDEMPFSSVTINNIDSAKLATNFLISKGHKEIGYLEGDFRIKGFRQRKKGYIMSLEENGISYDEQYTVRLSTTMDGAYKDMLLYLRKTPKLPTAFFADNDMIAVGALRALTEAGYKIPQDISIIGFDDLPYCEITSPRLSSIRVHKQEMGQLAVRQLLDILDNKIQTKVNIQVCSEFINRDSVKDINI